VDFLWNACGGSGLTDCPSPVGVWRERPIRDQNRSARGSFMETASSPAIVCERDSRWIQGFSTKGTRIEAGLGYRSVTGAGVGDNGTPCPFNRTHEMISRRGTHSRI